jgi:hypothetical protein
MIVYEEREKKEKRFVLRFMAGVHNSLLLNDHLYEIVSSYGSTTYILSQGGMKFTLSMIVQF